MRKNRIKALILGVALFWTMGARSAKYDTLSVIEKTLADKALQTKKLEIDRAPSNKAIDEIHIFTESPFGEHDSFFQFFNNFHVNSTDKTVRQSLKLSKGDPYVDSSILRDELLLGDLTVRSVIMILPVQAIGTVRSDKVDLLVVTKDVWSLRANTNVAGVGGTLSYFLLSLEENNIAGTAKKGGISFNLTPRNLSIGAMYTDTHFYDGNHTFQLGQSLILGRLGSGYEGLSGSFLFARPLLAETDKWGYQLSYAYGYVPVYNLIGSQIRPYIVPSTGQAVPQQYRWVNSQLDINATRSFGLHIKHNFTLGYGNNLSNPIPFADFPLTGSAAEGFISFLFPVKETEGYLYLTYQHFWNHYRTLYNVDTFSLAENFQVGPSISVTTQFAAPFFLSDRYFFRPNFTLGYAINLTKDSSLLYSFQAQGRYQGEWVNNFYLTELRLVAPKLWNIGRFVLEGVAGQRWNNVNNTLFALGGDSGLRAAISRYYIGTNYFRGNAEFRSMPLNIWSLLLGGVLFYDIGAAFYPGSLIGGPMQVIGAGLRLLILQFNSSVIRVDYGVPVAGPITGFPNGQFTFGFGQAF